MSLSIGIDATYSIGKHLSGVGRYSLRLMAELRALYPQVQWNQYYRAHRFLRAPWPKRPLFESTPRSCHLFHGLNQRLPKRSQIPTVSTFHDLFVMTGTYSSPDFRARFEEQARHAALHSDRIIAVSAFTANQISTLLGYPSSKIRVIGHGVDFPEQTNPIAQRKPIVLSVGAVQKRKNTQRLIEAFALMPAPWELWIAGSLGFEADQILASAATLPRVRLLGYVSDDELARLYSEASIFAFPSLDEGFGIPVLEAMSYGLPVLTSNTSALPEVALGAAELVDPYEVSSIASGLQRLQSESLREELAKRGRARAQTETWEKAAHATAAVYQELLGNF